MDDNLTQVEGEIQKEVEELSKYRDESKRRKDGAKDAPRPGRPSKRGIKPGDRADSKSQDKVRKFAGLRLALPN